MSDDAFPSPAAVRARYVSGVYENLTFGALDLASSYFSGSYARPDALWIARWDGNQSLAGWPGIPDTRWAAHQRAKQYRGDVQETYGGVTMTIDDDNLDAPVGTTAYRYTVTSTGPLNARSGPGTAYPVVKTYQPGATVAVACQAPGSTVASTKVWDKLTDGSYVTDYYISTPSKTGYSTPITRCRYPYQVSPATTLSERAGPGRSYPVTGGLPSGALAWVVCQQTGRGWQTPGCGTRSPTGTGSPTPTSLSPARPASANPPPAADAPRGSPGCINCCLPLRCAAGCRL
ncbi:MAG TPA: glycoside hydrolase domain-containing protein [Pseudonocardiaceae bacterium]|nr:glycoside hydrolase domain-containing protein [Pseudonocardiaceae bacterium]